MKIIIFYKSFTGATRQYAAWLKELIGADVKTFGEATSADFEGCEACVVMSGTYAGWMPLNRFLKKHWGRLEGKKVAAVAVGGIPPEHAWSQKSYQRIPEAMRAKIGYWKLPGKMDEKKMPANFGPMSKENLRPIVAYLKD